MTPAHRDALATGEPSPALCGPVPVLQHSLFPAPERRHGEGGRGGESGTYTKTLLDCTRNPGCQLHKSWVSRELQGSEAAAAFACVSSVWCGRGGVHASRVCTFACRLALLCSTYTCSQHPVRDRGSMVGWWMCVWFYQHVDSFLHLCTSLGFMMCSYK